MREAEGRRRAFRGKLRSIAATLEATRNPLIYDAYQKTVPAVRDLCADIRDDIAWYRRSSLDSACFAYCSLEEPEVRVSQVEGFFDDSVTPAESGDAGSMRVAAISPLLFNALSDAPNPP